MYIDRVSRRGVSRQKRASGLPRSRSALPRTPHTDHTHTRVTAAQLTQLTGHVVHSRAPDRAPSVPSVVQELVW